MCWRQRPVATLVTVSELAIEVNSLSKLYRPGRRPPGMPEWLWRRSNDRRDQELIDDDDLDDDEDLDEEEPPPEREQDVWALRDVSFEVPRGTAVGVVGPNGAGKSTLLKVLSRVVPPTEGRVVVRGRLVPMMVTSTLIQGELSGRKNAYLLARFLQVDREVVTRRMDQIAEFAEMGSLLDAKVRTYSTGLRKRLGLAIILNLEPDVLLADDSLVVGDADFRERCMGRIEEARREGLALVLASHNLKLIERFCDQAVLLEEGRIVERGSPQEITKLWAERRAAHRRPVETEPDDDDADADANADASSPQDETRPAARQVEEACGTILEARLVGPDGSDVTSLRTSESGTVEATVLLRCAGARARGLVSVVTLGKPSVTAFRSFQPEAFDVGSPGLYHLSIRLPGDLLATRDYRLKVSVMIESDAQMGERAPTLAHSKAFTFSVHGGREGPRDEDISPDGAVRPVLQWEVETESLEAPAGASVPGR